MTAKMFDKFLIERRFTVENTIKDTDKMKYEIPKEIKFPRPVTKRMCGKTEIFESQGDGKLDLTLMYIHGDAYCLQFLPFYSDFLSNISERTGCAFTTPNYPLTPKYTWKESHPMVIEYYNEFKKSHKWVKLSFVVIV